MRVEEGLLALRLGAVELEELSEAEAVLELDLVPGHGRGQASNYRYRMILV